VIWVTAMLSRSWGASIQHEGSGSTQLSHSLAVSLGTHPSGARERDPGVLAFPWEVSALAFSLMALAMPVWRLFWTRCRLPTEGLPLD
jgi:hypothetical protein